MAKKLHVEAQCSACGGTGIYVGYEEPKGVGVVCLNCDGTGKHVIEYIPFTGRKSRKGIEFVQLSAGNFMLTGQGPIGKKISYKDFLKGKMPKEIKPRKKGLKVTVIK